MTAVTLNDVIKALGAQQNAVAPNAFVRHFTLDSRQVEMGDVFIATQGESVDGHQYVDDALRRGAVAALVSRLPEVHSASYQVVDARYRKIAKFEWGLNQKLLIWVDNTQTALQRIAAFWRDKFNVRVIGVTGSIGKTSSKELIAQVLSARYHILKSEGNKNNEWGLPLTLLNLTAQHERAVLEMGMYARGEIAAYCEWAQPQVGVVTNVGPVHLERLGSIENIAQAKAELVAALPADGCAILNDDDERVRAMASQTKARVMTYGLTSRAEVWADRIESYGLDGISLDFHQGNQKHHARLPLLGQHSAHTALRAACVGLNEGMVWDEIIEAMMQPTEQLRLIKTEGPHQSLILDDSYNASAESTIAALNLLAQLEPPRIAVLGDMFELGDAEEREHRLVGCRAAVVAHKIVCVGERARWVADEAIQCGAKPDAVYHVATRAEAINLLKKIITERSVILIKGSRGMQMEEIVAALAVEG
jgi:UDP-N-acetylmuramoyl-tripeptide--D-alanyl-D-alanine ligase